MKIVTGYTGTPHVSSNDDQGFHQGIFGSGNNVLNVGSTFEAELVDATTVTIADGEGMLQGVHFRVGPGTVDTVNIDAGVVGYNRIDLICARYTKDANSGIESVDWHVIKGTPSASTPTAPDPETGDVLGGDLVADFPMYQITLTGVTPALTKLVKFAVGETKALNGQSLTLGASGNSVIEIPVSPGIYAISVAAQGSSSNQTSNAAIECNVWTDVSSISGGISHKGHEYAGGAKTVQFYLNVASHADTWVNIVFNNRDSTYGATVTYSYEITRIV